MDATPSPTAIFMRFAGTALLVPIMWAITQGLIGPNGVIIFYVVSIGVIPIAFALVILPGWRLIRGGTIHPLLALLVAVLMLPSVGVILWGIYTFVWLAILFVTLDF